MRIALRALFQPLIIAVCAALVFAFLPADTAIATSVEQSALPASLTIYRSPTCGCCKDWVAHMKSAGFQINDNVTSEMKTVRQTYGVPEAISSCHTALIDGYVVEGHVPAMDVQRLLAERPDVVGLTAPGMPVGSPGMEMDNRSDPYVVYAFSSDAIAAFAEHNQD